MRTTVGCVIAFVLGVVLALSMSWRVARAQVVPATYDYRSVYVGDNYTPDTVSQVANAFGSQRYRLVSVIQASPYGNAVLVFMRENP